MVPTNLGSGQQAGECLVPAREPSVFHRTPVAALDCRGPGIRALAIPEGAREGISFRVFQVREWVRPVMTATS
ncbi:hypothetical protein JQX13_14745 [Archangium violaceum]|uniref:hypothetical protein n=1 Tax=Archangium violaceum TaxID=83451 RepID=UPI00193B190F|nr:hypothetical protein [Archangium violaceum]QRK11215.1 hypothetical protein JQX13_14745 [Archangium violaceum]